MPNPTHDPTAILSRDFIALARLISGIENQDEQALAVADELYLQPKHSHIIGVTGLPGAGKSTLVNQLISEFVKAGKTVAVLAIDPTSPFTGGAVLGDRIRFQSSDDTDGKVFFRSMASRGHRGGISNTTADIVHVFNAAGFDYTVIETVGAGQLEVDIAYLTDTLVNVLTPEAGDDIQTIKAGIMEIGDIFVINKSDLPGAERKVTQLQMMLEDVRPKLATQQTWQIPVLKTQAEKGEGITELIHAIEEHKSVPNARAAACVAHELQELLKNTLMHETATRLGDTWLQEQAKCICDKTSTPRQTVQKALATILKE